MHCFYSVDRYFFINSKANSEIKLIAIHSIKCLLKQFCDDTCITFEADCDSSLDLERLFNRKAAQLGLIINYDTTEILT